MPYLKMNKAYLLLGGNQGDRSAFLSQAKEGIEKKCGPVLRRSAIYETAAWGREDQDAFLNEAVEISTCFSAFELLACLLAIEESLGRRRDVKYGPRNIDIDILLFNNAVLYTHQLVIPHPQLQNRRFVLVPLCEIAAGEIHPVLKKTFAQLLAECPDRLDVQKI